jgi:hypothetical protein
VPVPSFFFFSYLFRAQRERDLQKTTQVYKKTNRVEELKKKPKKSNAFGHHTTSRSCGIKNQKYRGPHREMQHLIYFNLYPWEKKTSEKIECLRRKKECMCIAPARRKIANHTSVKQHESRQRKK